MFTFVTSQLQSHCRVSEAEAAAFDSSDPSPEDTSCRLGESSTIEHNRTVIKCIFGQVSPSPVVAAITETHAQYVIDPVADSKL
jgi:hypothetical protein